jgi:hypothetical protein
MFTWICPQCGREVPPSYSECPTCAENRQRAAQGLPPVGVAAAAAPPQAPPPPQPAYQPPAPPYPVQAPTQFFQTTTAAPPPPQSYPPAQGYAPPQPPQAPPPAWPNAPQPPQPEQPVYTLHETAPSHGFPSWLVAILVALLAIGGFFLAYRLLGGKSEIATGPVKTDSTSAASQGAGANPYARYIEVAGIRIIEDEKQQIKATFVVVNHSAADMPSQDLQITLRSSTAKPEDDPVAVVAIKTGPLAANASKDLSVPLKTTLRAYELPDWQFLRAAVDVLPQH